MRLIRTILTSITDAAAKLFSATGRAGETINSRELFQHYGFGSSPLPGAEVLVVAQGNTTIAIASEDKRYRVVLASGEVCLYSDEGDKVHLKRGRIIEVVAGTKVLLNTPTTELSGDLKVAGSVSASGQVSDSKGSMSAMRTTYNTHTHTDSMSGTTTPPLQGMN